MVESYTTRRRLVWVGPFGCPKWPSTHLSFRLGGYERCLDSMLNSVQNHSCIKQLIRSYSLPETFLCCCYWALQKLVKPRNMFSLWTPATYLHMPHPLSLPRPLCLSPPAFYPPGVRGGAYLDVQWLQTATVLPSQAHTRWCLQASTKELCHEKAQLSVG